MYHSNLHHVQRQQQQQQQQEPVLDDRMSIISNPEEDGSEEEEHSTTEEDEDVYDFFNDDLESDHSGMEDSSSMDSDSSDTDGNKKNRNNNDEYEEDSMNRMDHNDNSSSSSINDDSEEHDQDIDMNHRNNRNSNDKSRKTKHQIPKMDSLYNPNLDEEDEAWVYKNLRGGIEEMVTIWTKNKSLEKCEKERTTWDPTRHTQDCKQEQKTEEDKTKITPPASSSFSTSSSLNTPYHQLQRHEMKMLKPRMSDAILSCPCCFQILCMDCQRHETYQNQFRAMFVMNVGVSWDKIIQPQIEEENDNSKKKKGKNKQAKKNLNNNNKGQTHVDKNAFLPNENGIQLNSSHTIHVQDYDEEDDRCISRSSKSNNTLKASEEEDPEEVYYSVHCKDCHTEVAALNMHDEVYHFFGCLASAG